MKLNKLFKVFSVVFILSFFVSACGAKHTQTSANEKKETTKLNIGTMPAPDSLPLYVAQKEGYFKAEGLDVKLTSFKSPKDRDAAIASGQLNAAVSDVVALASYVNGDLGWKSATALTGYFGIVTSDPAVTDVALLKGKTVATQPRQTPTFYLDQQLKAHGLTSSDVKIKEVAAIPVRLQLVEQHKADATILPDPFLSMAKASGAKVIAQSDPTKYQTTILAVDKELGKDQKVRAKFIRAYNKAVQTIDQHDASDYQEILVKDLGFPEAIAKNYQLPKYTAARPVATQMLKEAFNYAKSEGILHETKDPAKYQLKVVD
ncbi:ABC transporter substrate-binding protein [Ligilactobacillus faecis]|uniref:ABC transporter substrate-binding protein n=1 Tax=Ligilactobacillus faecis TaxID=762833 RepID=UPI002468D9F1|nr:ABC transporter substrate-binding protein [Ligilactobacillus faecis]WGN90445.1 ABC transporter substrate-binding protein [Ligilactobacillus faecis]